jgi:hypothetical protein
MWKPGAKSIKIVKAIVGRIVFYGSILLLAWWWMLWTPGSEDVQVRALNADEAGLEGQVRTDVDFLAGTIGERNVPDKAEKLEEAATFIFTSMNAAGYRPFSQWYSVAGRRCRNIEVEVRGTDRSGEVVVVGAHYDSVPGSPGADDNASGVAVMLALARSFAGNVESFRQLTFLSGQNVAWPVWATSGKMLAYTVFGVNTYLVDTVKPWNSQIPEKLPPFPVDEQLFNAWNWSPDGRMLAGFLNRDDGVAIYTPAEETFRRVTSAGSDPVWLKDSRRLLYHSKGRIHLIDSESGVTRELVSIVPEEIARRGFAVSPDDRYIYFSVSTTEADVWLAAFRK